MIILTLYFLKNSIFKIRYPSTQQQKASVFKFPWFEEHFQKAPLMDLSGQ